MDQKTPVPGIYKTDEGIFLNKDNEGLKAYKERKRKLKEAELLKTDINNLKADMAEIKSLLKELIK